MKFSEIIRDAGFNPQGFPVASEINVILYDKDDRIIPNENILFSRRIFSKQRKLQPTFFLFINELEKSSISEISVKISEDSFVVFTYGEKSRIFQR